MRYRHVRTMEEVEFPEPLASFDLSTSWQRVEDTPDEDLAALKREELNAMAVELGVEEPDKLPNKGAVIDEIQAAEAT